jgi:hypothetical protein
MKVLKGFSEDLGHNQWARADVELDTSDIESMLQGKGVTADLTFSEVYAILSLEVERLVTLEYLRAHTVRSLEQPPHVVERARALKLAVDQKLESLKGE